MLLRGPTKPRRGLAAGDGALKTLLRWGAGASARPQLARSLLGSVRRAGRLTQARAPDQGLIFPLSNKSWQQREQEAANLLPNTTPIHLVPSITCQDSIELFLLRAQSGQKAARHVRSRALISVPRVQEALCTSGCLTDNSSTVGEERGEERSPCTCLLC